MDLLETTNPLQNLDLFLGKETRVQEDLQNSFVSFTAALRILGEMKGELASKHMAELPRVLKPAVFCQVA